MTYETHTTSYEQHRDRLGSLVDLFAVTVKNEAERLYKSGMMDPAQYSRHDSELAIILIRAALERVTDSGMLHLHTKEARREVRNLIMA